MDLVAEKKDEAAATEESIKRLNPYAEIVRTTYSKAPLKEIINIGAFNLDRVVSKKDDHFLDFRLRRHDPLVVAETFIADTADGIVLSDFSDWIKSLLGDLKEDVYRFKGVLHVKGKDEQYVCHGVRELVDFFPRDKWDANDKRRVSRLVFIGRNVTQHVQRIVDSFQRGMNHQKTQQELGSSFVALKHLRNDSGNREAMVRLFFLFVVIVFLYFYGSDVRSY